MVSEPSGPPRAHRPRKVQPIIDEVLDAVQVDLVGLGFRQRGPRHRLYMLEVGDDVSGWLRLMRVAYPWEGAFELIPDVGVRHEGIQGTKDEILGQIRGKPVPRFIPTLGSLIGYAMPLHSYRGWTFSYERDNVRIRKEAIDAIRDYGIPFMMARSTIDSIMDDLINFRNCGGEPRYTSLAVAYMLKGDLISARKTMAELVENAGQSGYPSEQFLRQLESSVAVASERFR